MKYRNVVPVILLIATGALFSKCAISDDSIFTIMDDPTSAKKPFEGNINAGYIAQSGNSKSTNLTMSSNMTWYDSSTAWSIWGNASNASSNDVRSSEKYSAGGRSRYNLTDRDYIFGQAGWLSDRYNGYRARDTFTTGYGRQLLNGPVHSLRVEAGPGIRHDVYTGGGSKTNALGYASATYNWQLTENAKFIQGLSALGSKDTTVNSETALEVAISERFALKAGYMMTWNSSPPSSAPNHTDRRTQITLSYKM